MGNNSGKVIGSIIVIILALGLIGWQVYRAMPKRYTATAEQKAAMAANEKKVMDDALKPAMDLAAKNGWGQTGKYWAKNALGSKVKKSLEEVFGKNFNSADLKVTNVGRDSENGQMEAIFSYNGKTYSFHFELEKGVYKITMFGAW